MNIVKAGYERINEYFYAGQPLKKIERVARICYKSEDKITDTSYRKMCEMLLNRKHLAMFEHANVVLRVPYTVYATLNKILEDFAHRTSYGNDMMNVVRIRSTYTAKPGQETGECIVSGNIRSWYEFFERANEWYNGANTVLILYRDINKYLDGLFSFEHLNKEPSYACECELITDTSVLSYEQRLIHEVFTVIFTCDRGVTHELVRMRDASFGQESTRYCNYQLAKFGNNIAVIKPIFFDEVDLSYPDQTESLKYKVWRMQCESAEKAYFDLLNIGATPQEARTVLPQSVKADIAFTANWYEWLHTLNLRACDATGPAHPQMKEIMVPLFKELKEDESVMMQNVKLPN